MKIPLKKKVTSVLKAGFLTSFAAVFLLFREGIADPQTEINDKVKLSRNIEYSGGYPIILDISVGDELDFARKAIRDGFFDIAEIKLNELLSQPITTHIEGEACLMLGRIYYEKGAYAKAIQEFKMLSDNLTDRTSVDAAMYWTGEVYFKEASYPLAIEEFQSVLTEYPESRYAPFALFSQAWCFQNMGETKSAIALFRDVSNKYPLSELAIRSKYMVGEILYELKQYKEAVIEMKEFIRSYPVNERIFDAYFILGDSLYREGSFRDAVDNFNKALVAPEKSEWEGALIYRTGKSHAAMGNLDEAEKWFYRARNESSDPAIQSAAMIEIADISKSDDEACIYAYIDVVDKIKENELTERAYLLLGEKLYQAGMLKETISVYEKAMKRFPKGKLRDRISYDLAWAYLRSGDEEKALQAFHFTAGNSVDPDIVASSLSAIGDILIEKAENERAIDVYDRILREFPESIIADYAQYQLAYLFKENGHIDPAILAFQSLLINFPRSNLLDKSLYQLAILYAGKGDYESSLNNFERIIADFAMSSLYGPALLELGNLHYNNGNYEKAVEIYGRLITGEYEKDITEKARYQLGWSLYKLGDEEGARAIFNGFLEDGKETFLTPGILFWFGEYFYSKGDFDKAISYFNEVLEKYPKTLFASDALYWLAWSYCDKGSTALGVKQFQRLPDEYPSSRWAPEALLSAGDIESDSGEHLRARAIYETLLRKYPDNPIAKIANYRIGIILKDEKEYDLAIEYLRIGMGAENNDLNAQVQFDLAECYELKGIEARAIEEYLKVEYKYPNGVFWVTRARKRCAELLEKKGETDKAVAIYRKLAEGDGEEARYAQEKLKWLRK
ncbi:MAG: tetratricopeptide repeat protein [Candidatus Omnitrophica bacterium]|nr:tetratricopeptide repeat protein [Candidatus Omnitrophota bacterium]